MVSQLQIMKKTRNAYFMHCLYSFLIFFLFASTVIAGTDKKQDIFDLPLTRLEM
jgi:hypothetical protein